MKLSDGVSTRDLCFGKFDSPMAVYLHEGLLNGLEGESFASNGAGESMELYGRRILFVDNYGFVSVIKFRETNRAREAFDAQNDL